MKEQKQSVNMEEESISRLLLRFSLPSTLAMAVMASYNAIDAHFVGRLGSAELAALSIAFPVQMVFAALGIGTGIGAASLISRSLGSGKNEDARIAAGQVILIALALGLILTVTGFFLLEEVLVLFGATPEILVPTMEYMQIITNYAVLLFLIMMLNHSIRAEGNAMMPMIVMVASAVLNIALDPIFIFTLGMGIRGAAVATVMAKALGVAVFLWYYLGGRSVLKIRLAHLRPHGKVIYEIYRVGLPTLLMQASLNISLIVANRILGGFGYVAIAVMGAAVRLQQFAIMPVVGINQGLIPIVGYNYGAGKLARVREALLKGALAATVICTAVAALFFIFPAALMSVFGTGDALLSKGVPALRMMVIMYPLLGAPLIGSAFYQGIGRGLPALLLTLLRQFLLFIPLLLLLPHFFGLTGIWLANPACDLLTFIIATVVIFRELKQLKVPLFTKEVLDRWMPISPGRAKKAAHERRRPDQSSK